MNCLKLRQSLMSTPRCHDAEIQDHLRTCPACSRFAQSMDSMEHQLEQALQSPVPEDLTARLLLRQSVSEPKPRWFTGRHRWAMAAAVFICAGIAFMMLPDERRLAEDVIAYLHAHEHPVSADTEVAAPALQSLIQDVGLQLTGDPGHVLVAEPCLLSNRLTAHLILDVEDTPVTVILMPHEDISQLQHVQFNGSSGFIVPCPRGSIALIGDDEQVLRNVHARFEEIISWI